MAKIKHYSIFFRLKLNTLSLSVLDMQYFTFANLLLFLFVYFYCHKTARCKDRCSFCCTSFLYLCDMALNLGDSVAWCLYEAGLLNRGRGFDPSHETAGLFISEMGVLWRANYLGDVAQVDSALHPSGMWFSAAMVLNCYIRSLYNGVFIVIRLYRRSERSLNWPPILLYNWLVQLSSSSYIRLLKLDRTQVNSWKLKLDILDINT